MNDRYFFRVLLDRMIQGKLVWLQLIHVRGVTVFSQSAISIILRLPRADVKRQQPSASQAELYKRLQQVKEEAERIVAQAS
jgi:hypothetical protein